MLLLSSRQGNGNYDTGWKEEQRSAFEFEEEGEVSDQATKIGCSKARGGALAHDLAVQASLYKGPCPPPLHWHVLASVFGT